MTTVVIKLGGCNGSGKTSVVRALLDRDKYVPMHQGTKVVGYHSDILDPSVIVLGRYETACGGMDVFNDKAVVRALVHSFVKYDGILVMEGLIVGKTYGYIGEELYRLGLKGGVKTLWAFMDTPFDVCADRVRARREAKGNSKPFDPERTMRLTYTIMQRLEGGVRSGKYPIIGKVLTLKHTRTPAALAKHLLTVAGSMLDEG